MTTQTAENAVRILYSDFLDHWNGRNAESLAALFSESGNFIGFDGSQMNGREEILKTAKRIFDDHYTPQFTAIVREVRFLNETTAILRSVTGLLLDDTENQDVSANSVQSVIAEENGDGWSIALFQTTPAKFKGELREQLSKELREGLEK